MAAGPEALADLLARQARLREWIERLDEPQDDVPAHVADRVRTDYESRLGEVEQELRGHVDALHRDAERLHETLRLAREAHQDATDQLAEARLRHRLGEIDDSAWGGRRAELERAAEEAAAGERDAAEELDRLEELLGRLEEPTMASPTPAERTVEDPAGRTEPVPEPLPPCGSGGDTEVQPESSWPAGSADADTRTVDSAFLDGLDRAIGSEQEPDTRPTPGVKCPECGYTNDSNAWYCGVCGVDLT